MLELTKKQREELLNDYMFIVRKVIEDNFMLPEAGGSIYDLEDLYQEGALGLVKAINDFEKYDPTRGALSTFFYWKVRSFLQRQIWKTDNQSGLSDPSGTGYHRAHQGELQDEEAVKRILGMSKSLECLITDQAGEKRNLIDVIADENVEDPDFSTNYNQKVLRAMIRQLPREEALAVILYYGIGWEHGLERQLTQEQVGRLIGKSQSATAKLIKAGIQHLRENAFTELLLDEYE